MPEDELEHRIVFNNKKIGKRLSLLEIIFLLIFCSMLIGATIHISLLKKHRTAKHILTVSLIWVLAFAGVIGLLKFYVNVFHPHLYSSYLGWPSNFPWQYEAAIINLSIGILGLLCIWIHDLFWLATVISMTIRDWGAAIGHYMQLVSHYDFARGNMGLAVYVEIFHPILAIALLVAYYNVKKFPRDV